MYQKHLDRLVRQIKNTGQPVSILANQDEPEADIEIEKKQGDQAANEILAENPQISAATFKNILKSKGLKIVREANRIREGGPGSGRYPAGSGENPKHKPRAKRRKKPLPKPKQKKKIPMFINGSWNPAYKEAIVEMGKKLNHKKEADSASAFPQVMRDEVKESNIRVQTNLMEAGEKSKYVGNYKFRVVIIQEGLGNIKDSFFYTSDALKSAISLFEGKKVYADHPSAVDEVHRPERSVRDVLGHFEDVQYTENNGRGQLEANVVILPDEPFRWARALMTHSVGYAKKYPDKEFVGLSINASGEAEPVAIDALLSEVPMSQEMKGKIQKAKESGIETVRVVRKISDAVSCDLVTEAGAGGKVLELIEKNKN